MMNRRKFFKDSLFNGVAMLSGDIYAPTLKSNSRNKKGSITSNGIWITEGVKELKGMKLGPFVRLEDGSILAANDITSSISDDEGKTWKTFKVFTKPNKFKISPTRAMLKTHNGVIIIAFLNRKEMVWNWHPEISDSPVAIRPTYVVRSLDEGRTWQNPQKLHNEYTGAIRDIIQTQTGNIVFPSMMLRHHPGHHTTLTYTSRDDGLTWEGSNILDLGGIGDHSGLIEGTLEQLKSGELWMLMRTSWGTFWEATSKPDIIHWEDIKPTKIQASTAPGLIKRLRSGRLILIWNCRLPEGKESYPLRGGNGQRQETAMSDYREELSIAFSEDEGESWSRPMAIAKITAESKGDRIAYPYLFEAKPGNLWITTVQGDLRIKLNEKDFAHY